MSARSVASIRLFDCCRRSVGPRSTPLDTDTWYAGENGGVCVFVRSPRSHTSSPASPLAHIVPQCQFMSMLWFRALQRYTHAMRVDEDVCLSHFTPQSLLSALSADYAYGLETLESHRETLDTFGPWMRELMAREGLKAAVPPLPTDQMYFTNFFVTRVAWWDRREVRSFLESVNASGGTYRHRWGDAPIQTAALRLHGHAASIVHLDVDYVHMSTRNRIARGEEVAFNEHGLQNPHFRRLVTDAISASANGTGATNGSNASHAGTLPLSEGSDAPASGAGGAPAGGCEDVAGAFTSIAVCTGGDTCSAGVAAAASLPAGGCQMSIAAFNNAALDAGCPFPFTPQVSDTSAVYDLCPETCTKIGVMVEGCSGEPAAPPAAPSSPSPPPLPPLIPGPTGSLTVPTAEQMQDAIANVPRFGSLALFLVPGSFFALGGAAITVGEINLQIASDGEGATLDAQHLSTIFDVRVGAKLQLHSLILANGHSTVGGTFGAVRNGSEVVMSNTTIANSSSAGGGGVVLLCGGRCTMSRRTLVINSSCVASGGAVAASDGGSFALLGRSSIIGSSADGLHGGALWINGGSVTVAGGSSIVAARTKESGGAVFIDDTDDVGSHFVLEGRSFIVNSTAGLRGGAIYLTRGRLSVLNRSCITGSTSFTCGGGISMVTGQAVISGGSALVHSAAEERGGAVIVHGGSVLFTNESCVNHSSAGGSGGALYVVGGTVMVTNNSIIAGSTAIDNGGALYMTGGRVVFDGSRIVHSTAVSFGGGAFYGEQAVRTHSCPIPVPSLLPFVLG